mgnify:FL=1|tara:strand:- start:125 stop:379 length:255 start_codon:yes stop_codon:yes gene_type:complete
MILPSKHISPKRALISVAAEVHELINEKSTISSLWNELNEMLSKSMRGGEISYDWFILSVDLLFLFGFIESELGFIKRINNDSA